MPHTFVAGIQGEVPIVTARGSFFLAETSSSDFFTALMHHGMMCSLIDMYSFSTNYLYASAFLLELTSLTRWPLPALLTI